MFETLVSRLTSPVSSRRAVTSPGSREVQSDPETDEPVSTRGARPLLERRRRGRRAAQTDGRGMAALKAFLPLRPSKSLGRLDGIKEIERLAQYERLTGGPQGAGNPSPASAGSARRRGQRLSDLERVQDLFPNDFLALHEHDVIAATAGTLKIKTLLRKRPGLEAALGASAGSPGAPGSCSSPPRHFLMEAPCTLGAAPSCGPHTPSPSPAASQDRHLFLFTDLLLVAKSRGNNSFKLKEAVRLSEVWSAAGGGDTSFLLGWPGPSGPATSVLTYPTQAARDSWFRKIQNTLTAQLAFEPKTTNIQILYKDHTNAIEFSKTLSITPEMTTSMVIRQALQLVQGGVSIPEGPGSWGPARDFCLWTRTARDCAPTPLLGYERPHAIQMSRIRQTLSSDEGFDLEHVNSRNNPCGMIFELRKVSPNVIKTRTPLKLFRRSSGRLFGVPLVRLCPNGSLPAAVLTMLRVVHRRGQHTQGIFRKSANVKALKHLREKVDNVGAAGGRCPELDSAPVLLVASLLKDFLRSLPQPLMCDVLYSGWLSVLALTPTEKITTMRSLLIKLPKAHYNLLSYFIALLQAIARKSSINLMCPMNLAVCVGPSLLWPPQPCETAPKAVPPLIELLIIHAETLFGPQINNIFGKGSPEPSATLSLDSGAEESDSLHSVGLSLDSLDLNCTRKEKLSLSRDSGLTLSEDDSNSNGGNSPAPRNGLIHQVLPQTGIQTHQAQRVYAKCYTNDLQTINGLAKVSPVIYDTKKNNIYSRNTDVNLYPAKYPNDAIYGTSADVQKTIENQQKIYNAITSQNQYNSSYHDSHAIYDTSSPNRSHNMVQNGLLMTPRIQESSASKFLTGNEPEKPPRLGMTRSNRNAKVYSMHVENKVEKPSPARLYCRAKSSEDLLERRSERKTEDIYGLRSSQENIYGNVKYAMRQNRTKFQKSATEAEKVNPTMQSYSRVYGGWEQRVSNLTNPSNVQNNLYSDDHLRNASKQNPDNIYDVSPDKTNRQSKHITPTQQDFVQTPTSTIFTRKDWSRQASRTKSLDVCNGEDPYLMNTNYHLENETKHNYQLYMSKNEMQSYNNEMRNSNTSSYLCNNRSTDPAHVCTKKCTLNEQSPKQNSQPSTPHAADNSRQKLNTSEVKQNIHNVKVHSRKPSHLPKVEKPYGNKLVHSKSLANIIIHSNSSSSDTLYQPNACLVRDSPASSENSFSNNYSTEYTEQLYNNSQHDLFYENIYGKMNKCENKYKSDIYTAKPTSVGNAYKNEQHNQNQTKLNNADQTEYKNSPNFPVNPPPVPPRKNSHNSSLKNLPPVHLVGEERKSRSKSVPSIYASPSREAQQGSVDQQACHRAPITSYHLGYSDKFILALDESGTDTESESYV